jgi:hypothetical protein
MGSCGTAVAGGSVAAKSHSFANIGCRFTHMRTLIKAMSFGLWVSVASQTLSDANCCMESSAVSLPNTISVPETGKGWRGC